MAIRIRKHYNRRNEVITKDCFVEDGKKQHMCKHNKNKNMCIGCAVYTGHGNKPTLFE